MEISPLVQQARSTFIPKISQLYDQLFIIENEFDHSEGYWSEFFLLKPDKSSFLIRLEELSADDLLHFQVETQQLFLHAVNHVKAARSPSDEIALETIAIFLTGVLVKKYTNPSHDVITVLAGLHEVDTIFADFANAVEVCIRGGRTLDVRKKAIEAVLSLACGAYQTSLVSYFTHRDLFSSLMKYIHESDSSAQAVEPFILLGILANYNKFEHRNPYRTRMEDFVNEATIRKMIHGIGRSCFRSRGQYTDIIEDVPDQSWSLASALNYIGLGVLAPIKAMNPVASNEDHSERFSGLPGPEAAILLSTYDFVHANKLFSFDLSACPIEEKHSEMPFGAYLSLTSYILHHAYRSSRATLYGLLNLTTLRIVLEDPVSGKRLCSEESFMVVRLCRQRQPFLPLTNTPRAAAAQIMDISIDTINHNLRRRLDIDLYVASLALIYRILGCLAQHHIHLSYHWSLLWQSLLSLLRFLTTYATDLVAQSSDIKPLLSAVLKPLTLSITRGASFLSNPAYDDLFYKLVEHATTLRKFKSTYQLSSSSSALVDALISTAAHFQAILDNERGKGRLGKSWSPTEVSKIIRQGYETLEMPELELGDWECWREGAEKGLMKRIGRMAVDDVRRSLT